MNYSVIGILGINESPDGKKQYVNLTSDTFADIMSARAYQTSISPERKPLIVPFIALNDAIKLNNSNL